MHKESLTFHVQLAKTNAVKKLHMCREQTHNINKEQIHEV